MENKLQNEDGPYKSPVHKMMECSYFYETTSVNRSRKPKVCTLCGACIPKGSGSNGAKLFNSEFYQVDFCARCEIDYSDELDLVYSGELDDY